MTHSFTALPLLTESLEVFRPKVGRMASRAVLVCVQHLLETTGSLLETGLALGFRPDAIFVLGKLYSTNSRVAERLSALGIDVRASQLPSADGGFREAFEADCARLWSLVSEFCSRQPVDRIVILDDGGHCLSSAPLPLTQRYLTIGIEQTTSGIVEAGRAQWPVVQVATSAAKRHLEPHLISRAVLERVSHLLRRNGLDSDGCGVIGLGQIGSSLAKGLIDRGHSVVGFDTKAKPEVCVPACASLKELLERARVIFGCTGDDVFDGCDWIERIERRHHLISCSSEDREFRTLLSRSQRQITTLEDLLSTRVVHVGSGVFEIARGGFPVNFDGTPESVPSAEIQLTRFLLFAALAEALAVSPEAAGGARALALSPELQSYGALRWLQLNPERSENYEPSLQRRFSDLDWISQESGGERQECKFTEALSS